MLELYNSAVSTCSQKVRMTLAEKDLSFVDRQINFASNEHLSEWYLALNQNGVVPTLLHDGRIVTDSSVINEYLEEAFAPAQLVPRDPHERARMRIWRQYIDEVPTTAIRPPSYNAFVASIWAHLSDDDWEAHKSRLPIRKHLYNRMTRQGFAQREIDESHERLRQCLERMERSLESGPWLIGEAFTLADVSLAPTLVRMEDIAIDHLWQDLPQVARWYARIQQRPSFATAFYPGSRRLGSAC